MDKVTEKQFELGAGWRGKGLRAKVAFIVAVVWSVYTLAYLCKLFSNLGIIVYPVAHRAICAGLITILVFLLYPLRKGMARDKLAWYDILPILLTAAGCGYVVAYASAVVFERADANALEMALGISVIACLIEATRRTVGSVVAAIITFFFFYPAYSNFFPSFLHGVGRPYSMVVAFMYLHAEGLWGTVIGVVATLVAGFIIFGGFLRATGAGDFFNNLALATVGFMRGGAAKAAIIGSTLFGTISGSIAANVATVGTITIPLMKKTGYESNFAGAIEAAASTGGMFMPPVMGATAFLIAEFLGISYWSVCVAAFLPAIIYYAVLFTQVDLEAAKLGLKGLPRESLPSLRKTLSGGWQYLLPFAILIILLAVLRYTAETAIIYTLGTLIVVSSFKKESRLTPKRLLIALEDSARGMLTIAPLCAAIGLLVGSLLSTGAGTNLVADLLGMSGGNLIIIVVLTAAAAFVLGMGMTAVSVYILTVILLAPAMVKAGVEPLAAHMFLFYFGCLSFITPPVAVAAYIAAGISGGNPWRTGFRAVRLGVAAFLVPWAFIFSPSILMIGSPVDIILALIFTLLGAICVSVASAGYFLTRLKIWERILLALSGLCMFVPNFVVQGPVLAVLVILFYYLRQVRRARTEAITTG